MTDFKQTIAHIKTIEKHGGPAWYEWCELVKHKMPYGEHDWAEELRIWSDDECDAVYNTQACHAAIIAWCRQMSMDMQDTVYSRIDMHKSRTWDWFALYDDSMLDDQGNEPTQLAACLALIEAVADRLGEG